VCSIIQKKIIFVGYICAFDICLIPEPYEPLNVAGCPQKFWNYLASSRPIVSTRIPEQAMWEPLVKIADDSEQFCSHIQKLLACGCDDGLSASRLELARRHTWPRLAERLWIDLVGFGLVQDCPYPGGALARPSKFGS